MIYYKLEIITPEFIDDQRFYKYQCIKLDVYPYTGKDILVRIGKQCPILLKDNIIIQAIIRDRSICDEYKNNYILDLDTKYFFNFNYRELYYTKEHYYNGTCKLEEVYKPEPVQPFKIQETEISL
jgi:hypothetical protein